MVNKEIIELRKELHKYPELSGSEFETAKRIRNFVEEHHPTKIIEKIGGTGLAAIYEFPQKGNTITIRCELDALPIQEDNQFEHQSLHNGISHKCGHDGHMAMVAGLIFWLRDQSFNSGKLILLFQPSEENGKGAERVIKDKKFKELNTDYIFALHNIPQAPFNSVITMNKGFSAEVQSFIITLNGKESHAAEPENGINPSLAIAKFINAVSKLNNNNPLDDHFSVLTCVHINMGQKSYGISPSNGELHYTIRTWGTKELNLLKSRILTILKDTCISHNLEYKIEWLEYFPASRNNSECNQQVIKAAQKNKFKIIERPYPFKFGEDFGWFTTHYKTAMFGLGAGMNTPALHNSNYDFPDELIETGIDMFKEIITNVLSQ
ncbi:amidohydrolase [Aquimarina sp. ERC-38]|uniref:amidohydrolase n=1 Tax=Aquimarina sp. ERC-38 TaxID=2949996 RepID=UPI0022470F9C|nr:amidohydrolase [Aquimarina sp. ERC-38]UZO79652.1 amidohydrolase [Aquimarina sp. ERC-38]